VVISSPCSFLLLLWCGLFGWLVLFSSFVRSKYLRFVRLGCVYACFGWLAGLESRAARCMGVAVGWCLLDLDGNGNGNGE
jgi:hypothetical protein